MVADAIVALLVGSGVVGTAMLLFWPNSGLLSRLSRERRITDRVLAEDALKLMARREAAGRRVSLEALAGSLEVDLNRAAGVAEYMVASDLIERGDAGLVLTDKGRTAALHLIRAHRIWESYLAENTGYRREEWHALADEEEHRLSEEALGDLSRDLGYPRFDPDGDPIPVDREDPKISHVGEPLTAMEPGRVARVVHVEDEPREVYAQLSAMGICPGVTLELLENAPKQVRLWSDGNEHLLSPVLAANVAVKAVEQEGPGDVPEVASAEDGVIWLADATPGAPVEVVRIAEACRGAERRRFLDLGIVRGTVIVPEFRSPGGEPTAYRIKETLVALRNKQARQILVAPVKEGVAS